MKKVFLFVLIIAVIILAVGVFIFLRQEEEKIPPEEIESGIQVVTPKINEQVSTPLEIKGTVNGNGWIGFEGQVGTVKLLDSEGNELANSYLRATTNWMEPPVIFGAT